MSNKEKGSIIERSLGEKENGDLAEVQAVFVIEACAAKCPTCQKPCELTAGHPGLHHCPAGHEWV